MIYVADTVNHCVKVFDNTGKYLSRIGDSIRRWEDESSLTSLAIYENRILISHGGYLYNSSSILNYQLNGNVPF